MAFEAILMAEFDVEIYQNRGTAVLGFVSVTSSNLIPTVNQYNFRKTQRVQLLIPTSNLPAVPGIKEELALLQQPIREI